MAINSSLKLHYLFNAHRDYRDRISGVELTPAGDPAFNGNGLTFDGTGDIATTTDISWFNESEGVWYIVVATDDVTIATTQAFMQIDDGTVNNRHLIYFNATLDQGHTFVQATGTQLDQSDPGDAWVNGAFHRIAFYYAKDSARSAFDGTLTTLDSNFTPPTGMTTFRVADTHTSELLTGSVKEIRYYDLKDGGTRDADQFIQDLTNGLIQENADVILGGIRRRKVYYVQPEDKQIRFTGYAKTITNLGVMMEPFEFNHATPNRGLLDYDPSDMIARVDEMIQIEHEYDPYYDKEGDIIIHGGDYHPRVFAKKGNF